MAYFPPEMPAPNPNADDRDFWRACAERRLQFQTCADCGQPRHPPTPVCSHCQSFKVTWTEPRGIPEVFSYTVIHHASHEAVKTRLPYVVGVVKFSDLPGVRLVSNITDVEPAQVKIGMPLRLWWDDTGQGLFVPRFSPAT